MSENTNNISEQLSIEYGFLNEDDETCFPDIPLKSQKIIDRIINFRNKYFGRQLTEVIIWLVNSAGISDSFFYKLCFRKNIPNYSHKGFPQRLFNALKPYYEDGGKRHDILRSNVFLELVGNPESANFQFRHAPQIDQVTDKFDFQAKVKVFRHMLFHSAGDYFSNRFAAGGDGDVRTLVDVFFYKYKGNSAYSVFLNEYKSKVIDLLKSTIDFRNTFYHETDDFSISIARTVAYMQAVIKLSKFFVINRKTRKLSEEFVAEYSAIISQLQSSHTLDEVREMYREKYNCMISRKAVREYIDKSQFDDEFDNRVYLRNTDETFCGIQTNEAGRKMNNFAKEREEYLRQLSAYKGGVMNSNTLKRYLGSSTLVFSRDFVNAPQFLSVLENVVPKLGENCRARLLLPLCVKRELENRRFDTAAADDEKQRLDKILKQFRNLRMSGVLDVRVMTDDGIYTEEAVSRYLESEKLSNPCLITLKPGLYKPYEKNDSTTMYGKFLVNGDFMLYSSCLDRMGSGDVKDVRIYKTSDCSKVKVYGNGDVGGEGEVCATDRKGKAAKIFRFAADKEEKLGKMFGYTPETDSVCWPEEPLYDKKGVFRGYLMRRLTFSLDLQQMVDEVYSVNRSNDYLRSWNRRELVEICRSIALAERELLNAKDQEILMGDVSDKNIMIDPESRKVCFIDCDSYTFGEYKCKVKTPGYEAPDEYNDDRRKELYRFALLFFRILVSNSRLSKENVNRGEFSFETSVLRGSVKYAIWENMPRMIKQNFEMVFRHREGADVDIDKWIEAFDKYIEGIDNGRYSNEINPKRYLNADSNDFCDVTCDFCSDRDVSAKTNMPGDLYNTLTRAQRLLFCPECAEIENNLYQRRDEVFDYCTCEKCKTKFQLSVYEAMIRRQRFNGTIECPNCGA